MLVPLLVIALAHLSTFTFLDFVQLCDQLKFNLVSVTLCSSLTVFLTTLCFTTRPRTVYLVDFSCYKPEADCSLTKETFLEICALIGSFTEESLAFKKKILERSGLGQKTYFPQAMLHVPPKQSMVEARKEAETDFWGH
ncbi:hypothetical protein PTKIN_Ptkin10aG0034400 [Pterospermum kingtungense]